MAKIQSNTDAALSALRSYCRELGVQGEPSAIDASDMITDLLLNFDTEVAIGILYRVERDNSADR